MKKEALTIKGMSCVSCAGKIQASVKGLKGVRKANVDYTSGKLNVEYNEEYVNSKEIQREVVNLGYKVTDEQTSLLNTVLMIAIIVVGLLFIETYFGIANLVNAIPLAEAGMGYGMLFVVGILTSFHCISMCGGLVMSQCISRNGQVATSTGKKKKGQAPHVEEVKKDKFATLKPSFLYNAGRVLCYTIVGGIVGALGSVINLTPGVQGFIQLLGGAFMVIMGLNLLNVFPWLRKLNPRMPKGLSRKVYRTKRGKGPFYVGMANGLVPCGPLQAMQLFALATGNPLEGALSMFVFSLGTVPLMFGLGALSGMMSKKFSNKMMAVGAGLVIVLGVTMFNRGLALSGFTFAGGDLAGAALAEIDGDYQFVQTTMQPREYETIAVEVGIPVVWNVYVPDASTLNGCNNPIRSTAFDFKKTLEVGDNIITFTPTETGTFVYSCWMGMIRGLIVVQ